MIHRGYHLGMKRNCEGERPIKRGSLKGVGNFGYATLHPMCAVRSEL